MLGTVVNSAAIVVGSVFGILLKGRLKDRYTKMIMQAMGLAVLFVGISGAVKNLTEPNANSILFIISLVVGSVIGEVIDIERRIGEVGIKIQEKFKNSKDNISEGFVAASLLFCVGSMAILGSIESGIKGIHTTLFIKAMLDGISSLVFASAMGVGIALSAFSVLVYQGAITLFAGALAPYITPDVIRELSIVGGILIAAIGINLLEIKKIKVGNMLPGIFIPPLYYFIINLIG